MKIKILVLAFMIGSLSFAQRLVDTPNYIQPTNTSYKSGFNTVGWMFVQPEVIPYDKQMHFFGGFSLGFGGFAISRAEGASRGTSYAFGIGIPTLVGLCKELADSNKPNNRFDSIDWLYTIGGGVAASITVDLLTLKKYKQLRQKRLNNKNKYK